MRLSLFSSWLAKRRAARLGKDIEKVRKAYGFAPGNLPLLFVLVDALMKADRKPEALAVLQAFPLHDRPEEVRAQVGGLFLEAGDALSAFRLCTGGSAAALINRARACLALGNYREGLAAYAAAIATDPALEDRELRSGLDRGR